MKTLFHFRDFVKEISANNSRKYKQEVLRKYDNDVIILTYLQFAFNPYTTFGISTKKLYKTVGGHQITGIESVFGLLEYLKEHNTGTDQVVSLCQEILSCIGASDVEC
jgi:DNA ligase-1